MGRAVGGALCEGDPSWGPGGRGTAGLALRRFLLSVARAGWLPHFALTPEELLTPRNFVVSAVGTREAIPRCRVLGSAGQSPR